MKFILSFFLFAFITISCNSVSSSQKSTVESKDSITAPATTNNPIPITESATIVDYYRLLVNGGHIEREYIFKETANGWICQDKEDPERHHDCEVNISNGYLSVQDEGTGGGDGIMELALFKTNDGRLIFAYNTYSRGAAMYYVVVEDVHLRFFEYKNNTFPEVTDKVMKEKITPELFVNPSYKGSPDLSLYYALPNEGTTIRVLYNDQYCNFCRDLDENRERMQMDDDYYEEQVERCKICENIVKQELSIEFDREKGIFTLENK